MSHLGNCKRHSEKYKEPKRRPPRNIIVTGSFCFTTGRTLADFWWGLATEITNNVTGGLQEVGQNFSSQLSKLSTVISVQGVSQIVVVFEGDPTKFRDGIKSIEVYTLGRWE